MADYQAKGKAMDAAEREAIHAVLAKALGGNVEMTVRGGMLTMRADCLISALEAITGRDVIDTLARSGRA